MRFPILLGLSLLALPGCMSSVTDRLDETNRKLEATNQHLVDINHKLNESNKRLEIMEKRIPKFPGIGPEGAAAEPLIGSNPANSTGS